MVLVYVLCGYKLRFHKTAGGQLLGKYMAWWEILQYLLDLTFCKHCLRRLRLVFNASVWLDFPMPSGKQYEAWEDYDFFFHPEESLTLLEQELVGKRVEEIGTTVDEFFLAHDVQAVGFTGEDIQDMIRGAL